MGRGLVQRPPSCVVHPHRPATDRCDECFGRFCTECLVRGGPLLRCQSCAAAAQLRALEAARRWELAYHVGRLRHTIGQARGALAAVVGIAAGIALVGRLSVAQFTEPGDRMVLGTPVGRGVLARWLLDPERQGAPPSPAVPTPAPGPTRIPTLLFGSPEVLGGAPGSNLGALVDGRGGDATPVWHSAPGRVNVVLRFATREPVLAGRVLFAHSTLAPPETWAKEVAVLVSTTADDRDMVLAGQWTLTATTQPQEFAFPRSLVQSVWLRILSNYGSTEYTSLAEFALLPAQ